jgi:hypothetical protein
MKDEIVLMGIMLSDSAIREMGTGKVSYIGSFHQYQSPAFPLAVPPFVVTPILTNIRGKIEKPIAIGVRIEDPKTGLILANTVGNLAVQPEYTFVGSEVLDVSFPIPPLVFQSAGIYTVIVMVDGEKIGSRPLPVNSITAPLPPKV